MNTPIPESIANLAGVAEKASGSRRLLAHGILNFALTLEYLEESFYRQGLDSAALSGNGTAQTVFGLIQEHEAAHVQVLTDVINSLGDGPDPVVYEDNDFDFTALGTDPFASGNYGFFLTLAQGFEDTGVRAYKGQAPNIDRSAPYFTPALQIHSLEARHAAEVRRLRDQMGVDVEPWIVLDSGTDGSALEAIYGAGDPESQFPPEENTVQAGVDTTTLGDGYSNEVASASYDEPLDMDTVLAIADPFIVGQPNDPDN